MMPLRLLLLMATCLLPSCHSVKVFILAGQSNAEGQGSVNHLESLIFDDDPDEAAEYARFWDNGDFAVRDNVFMIQNDGQSGPLTVGYGDSPENGDSFFGPELGFGWLMGDIYRDEIVVIVKVSNGGTSLAIDWRPPSSGGDVGFMYEELLEFYANATELVSSVVPLEDEEELTIELEGFIWFQGYSDMFFNDRRNQYFVNLQNLLQDIREDLNAPDLPIVIGELGGGGTNPREAEEEMRIIQSSVANRLENTILAETFKFSNPGPPVFDDIGFVHYYGRADNYVGIGNEFALGMIQLLFGALPSLSPSTAPSLSPLPTSVIPQTPEPTPEPTTVAPATQTPTRLPTSTPTQFPTSAPTPVPTRAPISPFPSVTPSSIPTTARPLPTASPSQVPSPAPTVTAAPSIKTDTCDDDPDATFFVESINQDQQCIWLRARPDQIATLCVETHAAYTTCPETCGQCTDTCEDNPSVFFLVGTAQRNCDWLSLRRNFQLELCRPGTVPFEECQETCNNCPLALPSVTPSSTPSVTPTTPLPTPPACLGVNQVCGNSAECCSGRCTGVCQRSTGGGKNPRKVRRRRPRDGDRREVLVRGL